MIESLPNCTTFLKSTCVLSPQVRIIPRLYKWCQSFGLFLLPLLKKSEKQMCKSLCEFHQKWKVCGCYIYVCIFWWQIVSCRNLDWYSFLIENYIWCKLCFLAAIVSFGGVKAEQKSKAEECNVALYTWEEFLNLVSSSWLLEKNKINWRIY